MSDYFELSRQVEAWMLQCINMAREAGSEATAKTIQGILNEFRARRLRVVTVGEAKRGKSTLLNALLGEKEPLFPVDANVCTNAVTIVKYGKEERITALIADAQAERGFVTREITRAEIPDYVSEVGNAGNYKNVKLMEIVTPNKLLEQGLEFVDTPGVGSLNIEHAETTFGFLPDADLLIFVGDAVSGFSQSELDFLKRGSGYCKSILFPLTKKDLNPNYAEILEDDRSKAAEVIGVSADELQIIPISSLAKLNYLKTGRESMLRNSNFAEFEERLWATIVQRQGEVLFRPYLDQTGRELFSLLDGLAAQLKTLGSAAAQELTKGLNQKVKELEALQQQGAEWRKQLSRSFGELQTSVTAMQKEIAINAQDTLNAGIQRLGKKACKKEEYVKLLGEINEVISQGVIDLREQMAVTTLRLQDEIGSSLLPGYSINQEILKKLKIELRKDIEIGLPKKTVKEKLFDDGSKTRMKIMGGTFGGGIAGGVGGGPPAMLAGAQLGYELGSGVGGLIGGTKGAIDAFGPYDEQSIAVVRQALNNYIQRCMIGVGAITTNTLRELQVTSTDTMDEMVKMSILKLKENAEQIKKNIALDAKKLPERQKELQAEIAQLNGLLKQAEELAQNASSLIGAAPEAEPAPWPGPEKPPAPTGPNAQGYGFL